MIRNGFNVAVEHKVRQHTRISRVVSLLLPMNHTYVKISDQTYWDINSTIYARRDLVQTPRPVAALQAVPAFLAVLEDC